MKLIRDTQDGPACRMNLDTQDGPACRMNLDTQDGPACRMNLDMQDRLSYEGVTSPIFVRFTA